MRLLNHTLFQNNFRSFRLETEKAKKYLYWEYNLIINKQTKRMKINERHEVM